MHITANWLLAVAAFNLIFSLALAWLASLIVYMKIGALKRIFKAPHQLIRAHIDYLLMSLLLVCAHYLNSTLSLDLPALAILLLCLGALYNPFGFVILALRPEMANPSTRRDQLKILIGFVPATSGFGWLMLSTLAALA